MRILHIIIIFKVESRVSRAEPRPMSTVRHRLSVQWQIETSWWFGFTTVSFQQALGGLSPSCSMLGFTGALSSLASLRALLCLSHCDAFSHEEAPLYCTASMTGSACSHPWAAQAGGNLGTRDNTG